MNKIRFVLTTIVVLWCSVRVNAHDFEVDGIYYKIISNTDKTVKVTFSGASYSSVSDEYNGEIVIPDLVRYENLEYIVMGIGTNAFNSCVEVTSVTIPGSVSFIENYAFNGCSSLNNVILQDNVTPLSLGLGYSDNGLFYNIPLRTLYLGRDLEYNVSSDNKYSPFYGRGLINVTIGNSVKTIGESLFRECSALEEIEIGTSVEKINDYAFYGCSSLLSLTIPKSVEEIGNQVFNECSSIKELYIEDCEKAILLGAHLSNMYDAGLFWDCPIEKLYMGRNLEYTSSYDLSLSPFIFIETIKELIVGDCVTEIGTYAFHYCLGLETISLGENIVSIGYSAFSQCSKVKTIKLPKKLVELGDYAFDRCTGLSTITIPIKMTVIGKNVFYGCSNLEEVIVECNSPFSVSTMSGIPTSATLTVPNGSAKAYSDMGGFWGQFAAIKEEANVNISEENMWSTCVLAFDAELPEGVRAFISTGMDENSVLMEEVTTLEAYKPYVLYAQNGYEGTLTGVVDLTAYQETVTDGVLSGAIVKQEASSGYILQNQGQGSKFYNMNGQTFTIPAGKCWLSAFDAGASSVTMRFTGGVTGIEGVYVESPTDVMTDETIYDLEGRRVENPLPGRVYIKGGKKVMLKNREF